MCELNDISMEESRHRMHLAAENQLQEANIEDSDLAFWYISCILEDATVDGPIDVV